MAEDSNPPQTHAYIVQPYAMAQAGWAGGLLMLAVATYLAMYCGQLLASCMNNGVPGYQFQTYTDLGEHCAGRVGRYLGFYASYGGYARLFSFVVCEIGWARYGGYALSVIFVVCEIYHFADWSWVVRKTNGITNHKQNL